MLPEIKSADDKKVELSVEISVKSYVIVFEYYVNAFKLVASLHSQLQLCLCNHFDLTNCLSIKIYSLA